ncbi:monothiol glutaredoxin-s9 [Phtheirospermum japonicum]|uniref:Monothiol glutaredoxin-s9 n=1 Tax=Phtheirospermum japonicum TaxID=374723 RepID=A0A830D506_9LAMI|nr:monothiol glutaredoxin-s9 [Phtheirospermum japonicum]
MEKIVKLASENGILIFSKSTCCLCYTVQILFQELGVHPLVHDLDHDPQGKDIEKALSRMGCRGPLPAVFIGGKLVGSTNEVMSLHLSGSLLPLLRPYHQAANLS